MSLIDAAFEMNSRRQDSLEDNVRELEQENQLLRAACVAAVYPLKKWIGTDGFSEVLEMVELALNHNKER
jgi:hypothetical protein